MRELRPLVVAGASVLLLASSVYGADYSLPPPDMLRGSETVVGPPTYPRWDGFYFGGQIGRSFGSADFSNANSSQISFILANTELQSISDWTTLPKGSSGSTAYGGFLGYNIQWGEVITGFELNYNHVAFNLGATGKTGPIDVPGAPLADGSTVMYNNVTVNSSATVAIHDFATARARFGWTYDRLLPYAFVGFAVSRADVTRSADVSGSKTVTPPLPGAPSTGVLSLPRSPQSESKSLIAYGFTAGLGLDVAITPNLFLRGEWEYVQLPNVNDVRVNLNSVHAGLGFKF